MDHRTRRAVGGLAASAVAFGVMAALPTTAVAVEHTTTITLLNINDFHGRIDANTVRFAGTVEELREDAGEDNTLFLSAGDNIGASLFASAVQEDEPTIDVLNALELRASAVGNHEFDRGFEDLDVRVDALADFPYLGANVYESGTTTPAMDEYALIDVAGLTVGVIGVVTAETPALVSPGGIATLDFGDPVEAVNRVADQLSDDDDSNGEADVIVAQFHEGAATSTSLEAAIAATEVFDAIVNETSAEVDAIFTGHTHGTYAWDGPIPGGEGTRPIVQTGSYGANIGVIELTVEEATGDVVDYTAENVGRTTTTNAELIAAYPRVAEVNDIVTAALEYAAEVGSEPVGEVTADITTAFTGGTYTGPDNTYTVPEGERAANRDDRASASTLATLVADALRDTPSPAGAEADFGVVNPGGLRAELYYGDDGVVTYAEANAVLPFVNNLWHVTLTGEQVVTLLNQQWQRDRQGDVPSRPYLQLGLSDNVSYVADPSLPEGSRIVAVTIDGEPIDLDAEYRIATFSFLAQGGDNFHVFRDATDVTDTGLIDRDAWISYLEDASPVSPDFAKTFVEVSGLTEAELMPTVGDQVSFEVSNLNMTSLGSPLNTSVEVTLDGVEVGTFAVEDGAATITFTASAALVGDGMLMIEAMPSGTTAWLPMSVWFGDVSPDTPYADAIVWLAQSGITGGYTDGTFRPFISVNRGQMAAFLYRFANENQEAPECTTAPFSDIPVNHPFCGEIAWLVENEVTGGYTDGTYRPYTAIDRGQMAAFLFRFMTTGEATACTEAPFPDVPQTHTFCAEIDWLAETGITAGYTDGTFRPESRVLRGAMAAFLQRAADTMSS